MLVYDFVYLAIIVVLFLVLVFSVFHDMYRKKDLEQQMAKYNKLLQPAP